MRDPLHASRLTALVISVALTASACTTDPLAESGDTAPTATEATSALEREFTAPELTCEVEGYPCSWAEAEPGTLARTGEILTIATALATTGDTAADVAAAIEAAPDIASVAFDDFGVMFRVSGGVPVFVDIDPTGTGDLLTSGVQPRPGTVLPNLADGGVFTGCPKAETNTDRDAGVALKAGEGKHALLLSPWQFGLPWDLKTLRDKLQLPKSRYREMHKKADGSRDDTRKDGPEASVTVKQTPSSGLSVTEPSVTNVVPADFCGWEKYATIILMTHGRAVCKEDARGALDKCITSFSVGQFKESLPEIEALVGTARGVTVGTNEYGSWAKLTPQVKAACIAALERVVFVEGSTDGCFQKLPKVKFTVKVTTEFFRHNYPNGLPDRLIFLAACQGMKFGDMGTALGANGHGRGQLLGFSRIARLADAQTLLNEFTRRLGEGERIGDSYKRWANNRLDNEQANADLNDHPLSDGPGDVFGDLDTSGHPTWGSDVVSLGTADEELLDGGEVTMAPTRGDADRLLVTLMLSDVVDGETPEQYGIEVLFNDKVVDIGTPNWTSADNNDVQAEVVVRLPRALAEDETFDLEIRGVLPAAGGAPTRWKYTDLTAEVGTACDVLTDAHVSAALGVTMTRNPMDVYGQGVFGDFCGWGTESPSSEITLLVVNGGAEGFRADWENSDIAVDGFGDVATYDTETGRGSDCSSIGDNQTGEVQWVCFVNLNVAVGDDALYFTLSGNVVGENGTDAALAGLRDLVGRLRNTMA